MPKSCDSSIGASLDQITAASLLGKFGKRAQYWSERMLDEGRVHILASDAHDVTKRPVNLRAGRDAAALRVGEQEAETYGFNQAAGILANGLPSALPMALAKVGGRARMRQDMATAEWKAFLPRLAQVAAGPSAALLWISLLGGCAGSSDSGVAAGFSANAAATEPASLSTQSDAASKAALSKST